MGRERGQNRVYRRIYRETHGEPPYVCGKCHGEMITLEHVHHKDEDPKNNDPENLEAQHAFCHNSMHHVGMQHSEDTKKRIGASVTAACAAMTREERRAKWSAKPFEGRCHTSETRATLSEIARSRARTCEHPDCDMVLYPMHVRRHWRKRHGSS